MNLSIPQYGQDFYAWTKYHASLLRQGRLAEADIEHLAEELDDMGDSRENQLESRLGVLIAHLLKWQYRLSVTGEPSSSWAGTIVEQRRRISRLLKRNPSLKKLLPEILEEMYGDSLAIVQKDTGRKPNYFPQKSPYTVEQILTDEFYPD